MGLILNRTGCCFRQEPLNARGGNWKPEEASRPAPSQAESSIPSAGGWMMKPLAKVVRLVFDLAL